MNQIYLEQMTKSNNERTPQLFVPAVNCCVFINHKVRQHTWSETDLGGLHVATVAQRVDGFLKGMDGCAAAAGKWFNFLERRNRVEIF